MRVAIYARVSTTDKGQTTENQVIQLRAHASALGWTIVDEYLDYASGKSGDREQFRRLFKDAIAKRFDLVLFWSLDRFSREGVLETLTYLQQLTKADICWKSLTEQFLDSCGPFRDAVLSILATIAKQERIRMSERVKAGLARVKANGTRLGRPEIRVAIERVKELRAAGLSLKQIGEEMGLSTMTVYRAIKDLR